MAVNFGANEREDYVFLRLNHDELDRLIGNILSPAAIKRVQIRAINETTNWMRTRIMKELTALTGLPKRVFDIRIRQNPASVIVQHIAPNYDSNVSGGLWLGLNPIDPLQLKDQGPIRKGYMAGGYYFEGGFKATMRSGYESIFTRAGRARMPIKREEVKLDTIMATRVARRLILPAERMLQQKIMRLVSYELERNTR